MMTRYGWLTVWLMLPVWMGGCPPVPGDSDPTAWVSVVHTSPDAPLVDVCAEGGELFLDLGYRGATEYAEVLAGVYQFKLIPAGAGCGSAGIIAADVDLPDYTDTTIVAIDFLSRLDILVLDDDNSVPPAGFARMRFVHTSVNTPVVDLTLATGTTLFDDVGFAQVSDYIEIQAGTYDLDVRDTTATTLLLPVDGVTLIDGAVYTFYLVGLQNGSPALELIFTRDR